MTECACVDGEWGEPCPACGQRLPLPPKVCSWKSQQPLVFASGSSAGLGARDPGQLKAAAARRLRAGFHRT